MGANVKLLSAITLELLQAAVPGTSMVQASIHEEFVMPYCYDNKHSETHVLYTEN